MTVRCSICSEELDEAKAVTFTAGDILLFRPCDDCAGKVRQVARGGLVLGGRKLKAVLEDRIPNLGKLFAAAKQAARVAAVFNEED